GWVEKSPPMQGGEYLSSSALEHIWNQLNQWGTKTIESLGGVEKFLEAYAPGWNKVGRVTFHLAENRNNSELPFAFMASFTTGISSSGQLKHLPLGKALELYSGSRNKPALIRLLEPVNKASQRCQWVREMVEDASIYRPAAWTARQAYTMLKSADELKDSGLMVRVPDWWKKRPRPVVNAVIGEKSKSMFGIQSMLDFRVQAALGDQALSRQELEELMAGESGLILFKGQWIEVDRKHLKQALDHWKSLEKHSRNGEVSFIEGMRMLAGTSRNLANDSPDQEEVLWATTTAGKGMKDLLNKLRSPSRISENLHIHNIKADLRPYQLEGTAWLNFLAELGLGACLADDMGLGKTLQILAMLTHQSALGHNDPSLLVVPASLLGNWRTEARKFAPGLRLLFYHPSEISRKEMQGIQSSPEETLNGYHLVVTTYALASRTAWLKDYHWQFVILDEAQAIKNHAAKQTRAVKKIPAKARIALTGTPIENRLGDLWSLFDFLNPGLLGNSKKFQSFVNSLEKDGNRSFGPLRKLVSPYILRRLKTDKSIIADLPDKTETVRYCSLTSEQVRYYSQAVKTMQKTLMDKTSMDDMSRKGIVLQTLMRLKQICNHPGQFLGDGDFHPDKSGKFARIAEICSELAQRQEKVLIFTQFREIIPFLAEHLEKVFQRPGLELHGGTSIKKRKAIVEDFQNEDGPPFFILSLKAGGTGLNLTAASHVIHFDRWWNPAVENQATDRSFRIGQQKNVLVHKFVVAGTIEEKIHNLISEKKELAETMLSKAGEIKLTELPDNELLDLVKLDISRASRA
ncbi:MAG: DEAD/DEAH box helicase, partial [Desulfonatronovibrionaceae bacterium]